MLQKYEKKPIFTYLCQSFNSICEMESFEEQLRKDLHQFLLSMKEVDERMPECPDVEDKWEEIAKAYIPDGIREFQDFLRPHSAG